MRSGALYTGLPADASHLLPLPPLHVRFIACEHRFVSGSSPALQL